jgi:hypothetical protein
MPHQEAFEALLGFLQYFIVIELHILFQGRQHVVLVLCSLLQA